MLEIVKPFALWVNGLKEKVSLCSVIFMCVQMKGEWVTHLHFSQLSSDTGGSGLYQGGWWETEPTRPRWLGIWLGVIKNTLVFSDPLGLRDQDWEALPLSSVEISMSLSEIVNYKMCNGLKCEIWKLGRTLINIYIYIFFINTDRQVLGHSTETTWRVQGKGWDERGEKVDWQSPHRLERQIKTSQSLEEAVEPWRWGGDLGNRGCRKSLWDRSWLEWLLWRDGGKEEGGWGGRRSSQDGWSKELMEICDRELLCTYSFNIFHAE